MKAVTPPATQNHMMSNQNLSTEKVPKVGLAYCVIVVGELLEDYGREGKNYCCQHYSKQQVLLGNDSVSSSVFLFGLMNRLTLAGN